MDTALASIGVAALSALTIVAYKHPTGYRRLFWGLLIVFAFSGIALWAWDQSNHTLLMVLLPLIDADRSSDAIKAAQNLRIYNGTIALIMLVSMAYLSFLLWLPVLLGKSTED